MHRHHRHVGAAVGAATGALQIIAGRHLAERIGDVDAAPAALIAIGRPVCPACQMLPASLAVIAQARPTLAMMLVDMADEDDWVVRETVLWPRGIHVSPAAIPVLALMVDGHVVATRQGSAPAADLDAWITQTLGGAKSPVPAGVADAERAVLQRTAARRAQHRTVKDRQGPPGITPRGCSTM